MKIEIKITLPQKLEKAIVSNALTLKRGREKSLIKSGEVKVNGNRVRENVQLRTGDVVTVFVPEMFLSKFDIPTVYEDNNLLIVDKPHNVESEEQLPKLLAVKYGRLYPLHRLDTNTTGLIMFARTGKAYLELSQAFKNKLISKTYYAELFGEPAELFGEIRNYLCKDIQKGIVKICDRGTNGAQEAITRYEINRVKDGISYALLYPETGRTHQLRVHMAWLKCPIVGDTKYGDFKLNREHGVMRQTLRAVKLKFGKLSGSVAYLSGREIKVRSTDE